MTTEPMTCDEFRDLASDYLEGSLERGVRERAEAHVFDCEACAGLVADLQRLTVQALALPTLTPSRELWAGIEARIQAEVVELQPGDWGLGTGDRGPEASPVSSSQSPVLSRWRAAAAVLVLVGATATVTWFVAVRSSSPTFTVAPDSGLQAPGSGLTPVARPGLAETYDVEIASLRRLVDERRAELDPVTLGVLERNLKLIDDAIAESRAALADSPSSALLLQQLTDAYDTKLRVLRAVATMPLRG